jgi:hypothetical protein
VFYYIGGNSTGRTDFRTDFSDTQGIQGIPVSRRIHRPDSTDDAITGKRGYLFQLGLIEFTIR